MEMTTVNEVEPESGSPEKPLSISYEDNNDDKTKIAAEAIEPIKKPEKSKPPPIDISGTHELQHQSSHESRTPTSTVPPTPGGINSAFDKREKKIGHRRVDEEGLITYKKIQTTQIMGSIQLGISYAVGSLASKPERDLLMQDFAMVEMTFFPGEGSNITPAHHYSDFRFKTYSPVAFRYFRDLFGIQPDDFLLSVCNEPLRELTNPGASGSIFYLTNDDEFIIKTVQHKEAEFLQKLLPGYYMNLNQNPRTLLPKFFGLYNYQCGGKNVRLIVMNNLLPSFIKLHQKYDLKGSTYKRRASKHERKKDYPTYKDLDFMEHHTEGILLEAETYSALMKTIQRDCRVLESFKIMDYSMLVGIHNLDQAARDKAEQRIRKEIGEQQKRLEEDCSGSKTSASAVSGVKKGLGGMINLTRSKSINRQRLAAFSTAMESIQAEVEPIDPDEDVPAGGIPARNSKGERLLLFLGIIDILQSYRLKKKLEHTWKAMLHDGDTVSVHRPGFYATRFLDFMGKTVFKKIPSPLKHSPSKRKGASLRHRPSSLSDNETRMNEPIAVNQGVGPMTMANVLNAVKEDPNDPEDDTTETDDIKRSLPSAPQCSPMPNLLSNSPSDSPRVSPVVTRRLESLEGIPRSKPRSSTDPVTGLRTVQQSRYAKVSSNSLDKSDVVSISQVTIQTESIGSVSESSSGTSGLGSTIRTATWTPPHSVAGSTPTHTEGTPSFTESSSSGDIYCPTTPIKSQTGSRESFSIREATSQLYYETEMLVTTGKHPFPAIPTHSLSGGLCTTMALAHIAEDTAQI